METVSAGLSINIYVTCPNEQCCAFIDLMDQGDTDGQDHNEEGYLLSQACPNGHWSEEHERFEAEEVVCSKCKTEFNVKGLDW